MRGQSCVSTLNIHQNVLKNGNLLHKQGFVDSQFVTTVEMLLGPKKLHHYKHLKFFLDRVADSICWLELKSNKLNWTLVMVSIVTGNQALLKCLIILFFCLSKFIKKLFLVENFLLAKIFSILLNQQILALRKKWTLQICQY